MAMPMTRLQGATSTTSSQESSVAGSQCLAQSGEQSHTDAAISCGAESVSVTGYMWVMDVSVTKPDTDQAGSRSGVSAAVVESTASLLARFAARPERERKGPAALFHGRTSRP